MARAAALLVTLACASLPAAGAWYLRGGTPDHADPLIQLGLALTDSGASAAVEERVANMTEDLRPVFLALPRSADGYLEPAAVKYLLHRYFNDRDGWFVQGTDESADDSLPQAVLQGGPIAEALSKLLAARGLSLREVAVMAAALETLAAKETELRLHHAYTIVGRPNHADLVSESEADAILEAYLVMYLGEKDFMLFDAEEVRERLSNMHERFPKWDRILPWVKEVRSEILNPTSNGSLQQFSFSGQVRALDEMEHRYAHWEDAECLTIKSGLLELATPGTGRVPLHEFYTAPLPGGWAPEESKAYLHAIGALDDRDPDSPSVVVANYFESPANCARPSKYYSICCISECEALLGQLERKLGSPNALPQDIVDIVEHIPSASMLAGRTLPAELVERLESIAASHGGHAPMHGRLFRQWMHHAYPNECSFPAVSLTSRPPTPEEFFNQTGENYLISDHEKFGYIMEMMNNAKGAKEVVATEIAPMTLVDRLPWEEVEEKDYEAPVKVAIEVSSAVELPWSDDEELFITCSADGPTTARQSASSGSKWRGLLLVPLVCSVVYMLAQTVVSAKESLLPSHKKKYSLA